MEKVLDRTAVSSGCKLDKNEDGSYDLEINDDHGRIVATAHDISFQRAVVLIEDYFFIRRRESHD